MRGAALLLGLALAGRVADAAPTVVVRAGDPSPLGFPFSRFSDAALDDRGRVSFVGSSTVLFQRAGGGIARIVGAGNAVEGHELAGVGTPALGAECLAFRAGFVGGGAGIFRQCGGTIGSVAVTGQAAPGGGTFVGFADEVANGAGGRVAFTAVLDDASSCIVLIDGDGTPHDVVRTGRFSPAGGTYTTIHLIGVSATGRVAFRGITSGGPDGLFYWDRTDLRKFVVVSEPSQVGSTFKTVGLATMNDAETWTFRAALADGRSGVFRGSSAAVIAVTPLAISGAPTPIGGTFKDFPSSLVPVINTGGLVAFRATVEGASFTSGLFVALPDGTLVKVAAVGEPTAAGVLARLRELALADDGGTVFRASLTGGTQGLFLAAGGSVDRLAVVGDATDAGTGFRFGDASVRTTAAAAVFVGTREAVFQATAPGTVRAVATLGQPTPLKGRYAAFDQPASGGSRTVFGASIQEGRAGEALLVVGRRNAIVLAKNGDKVGKAGKLLDFFSNPLDDLARPGVSPAGVAFQTGLGGGRGGAASGIILWSGGELRAMAREGQKAPGGGKYRTFGTPAAVSPGGVAFVGLAHANETGMFRVGGGVARLLASSGQATNTRLRGVFRGFGPPATGRNAIAFQAMLEQSREGVFIARGRCTMALAGTGEVEPGGGKFKTFTAPTYAGPAVVFRATLAGSNMPALYRATPTGSCTQVPPTLEAVAGTGASPAGTILDFGAPAGNRRGAFAYAADLTGAGPTDTIILDQ